ncbi:MAG: hypothetical protein J1F23_06060 [Oscillospiraceae bacterium]|nr:hypothetical protein [Oscillospiraceae bacterium]
MKIEVKERPMKMVCCWMSAEEGQDKELMASLRPRFKEWKSKNYQPVVYISGTESLEEGMYMLMKRNYEELAKKQLAEEAVAGGIQTE